MLLINLVSLKLVGTGKSTKHGSIRREKRRTFSLRDHTALIKFRHARWPRAEIGGTHTLSHVRAEIKGRRKSSTH